MTKYEESCKQREMNDFLSAFLFVRNKRRHNENEAGNSFN